VVVVVVVVVVALVGADFAEKGDEQPWGNFGYGVDCLLPDAFFAIFGYGVRT
jgi:hypothetical protein